MEWSSDGGIPLTTSPLPERKLRVGVSLDMERTNELATEVAGCVEA